MGSPPVPPHARKQCASEAGRGATRAKEPRTKRKGAREGAAEGERGQRAKAVGARARARAAEPRRGGQGAAEGSGGGQRRRAVAESKGGGR